MNETSNAAEDFFRNLLKKVHGESVEGNNYKIIQDETELRSAFCNLYNKSNETDGTLDKRDKRLLNEMRKLNSKLMKLEDKLVGIENTIRTELQAFRDELFKKTSEAVLWIKKILFFINFNNKNLFK